MYFDECGGNTMRRFRRTVLTAIVGITTLIAIVLFCGCAGSEDTESPADTAAKYATETDSTDIKLIQEMFTEAAVRWHYGDKAVLYDLEFEYLQDKYTFDEYLDFRQIQYLEADTLEALTVKDVQFYGRDSALASAEAMFIGPTGDTSRFTDLYPIYFHRGRWIRPTAGAIDLQVEFEERRRVADSAAAAEAELEDF